MLADEPAESVACLGPQSLDAFLDTPSVIGGWSQQSRIEHLTLSFRYSKAFADTPLTTELVDRVWQALSSFSSSTKIFGGGLAVCYAEFLFHILPPVDQGDSAVGRAHNHLAHFFATGRFLGRAPVEGNVTGFHLALPLLKTSPCRCPTASSSTPRPDDGGRIDADSGGVVGLIPNGRDVEVTDANKAEFGVYEVVPPEMLMLFDAEELDYVLSGSDDIDVEDWERNSKWTFDLEEHPVREWFWELVREMPRHRPIAGRQHSKPRML
ncbi:hypothetical protein P43SY_010225 [Pythium insidiosum]|uniref:HECT-type E3 ubiquitin transferase n=1 Tax=Pythium insidiosum TaxID=114742 RepID=A0AAD5LS81_PYTIN|nr:hypothetical protein P43SY_010225 [Pythium insidiosum]